MVITYACCFIMTKKQLSREITQLREPETVDEWLKQIDLFQYCAAITDYAGNKLSIFEKVTAENMKAICSETVRRSDAETTSLLDEVNDMS